jgi:hypothetical protein
MYESDITKFVRDMMDNDPHLRELQKNNRATWWDKTQNLAEMKSHEQSAAPKQPYAYFPLPLSKK